MSSNIIINQNLNHKESENINYLTVDNGSSKQEDINNERLIKEDINNERSIKEDINNEKLIKEDINGKNYFIYDGYGNIIDEIHGEESFKEQSNDDKEQQNIDDKIHNEKSFKEGNNNCVNDDRRFSKNRKHVDITMKSYYSKDNILLLCTDIADIEDISLKWINRCDLPELTENGIVYNYAIYYYSQNSYRIVTLDLFSANNLVKDIESLNNDNIQSPKQK